MKICLNKTKTILATLGAIIISFSSKVAGQLQIFTDEDFHFQTKYGIEPLPKPRPEIESTPISTIKLVQIGLIAIIFIVGIINLLRIIKINDKTLKKKKIRNTIIIISILILLLIAALIIPARLLTK